MPDEDLAAEMYKLLLAKIAEKNYRQYEISNFSLPGFESKHNSKYWTLHPVIGFGCSAHSFDGENRRWSNERDTLKYVESVENESFKHIEDNDIDVKFECLFLGLRLNKGLDIKVYEKRFSENLVVKYKQQLDYLEKAELIKFDGNFLKLTDKGFLYSNEVFTAFA